MQIVSSIKNGSLPRYVDHLVCLLLCLAIVAVFGHTIAFSFVNFDDPLYFEHNRFVRMGLTPESITWAFTDGIATTGYWAPLTLFSLLVDSYIYGPNASGYHLTNLLLHIANTWLLYAFFRRATGEHWPSALVALLFAIHPLHVESVAWITERKDVLSTLFWLLTMLAYLRYTEAPGRGRYLTVLAVFIAGIMAKPMLVTLPFVLLLLDYWPLGRFSGKRAVGRKSPVVSPGKLVVEKLPLFAIALATSLAAFLFQQKAGAVAPLADISAGVRIANTLTAYAGYIQDMLWPADLAVLYPHPGALPLWLPVLSTCILVGITWLVLWKVKTQPYLLTGWGWYLTTLAPVSGLVVIGPHATADRYTYVPLIGLFIMIAWALAAMMQRGGWVKKGLLGLTITALIVLGVTARLQTLTWENSVTLFEHALAVTEKNEHAHINLGNAYREQGRLAEALVQYHKALEINPRNARVYMNIGILQLEEGQITAALRSFDLSLKHDPLTPRIHNNIGNAYLQLNDAHKAGIHFREALRRRPFDEKAHNGLGVALLMQGQTTAARQHFKNALRIHPGYPSARHNLKKLDAKPGGPENPAAGES